MFQWIMNHKKSLLGVIVAALMLTAGIWKLVDPASTVPGKIQGVQDKIEDVRDGLPEDPGPMMSPSPMASPQASLKFEPMGIRQVRRPTPRVILMEKLPDGSYSLSPNPSGVYSADEDSGDMPLSG